MKNTRSEMITKMKIPDTFLPNNNLEKTVKNLLKSNNPAKKVEEQKDYKKRKIVIQSNNITDLLDNEIYVLVKHPKGKKGYSLNIKSLYKFFYPSSGSNVYVPALLGKTKAKGYVRNEGMLIEYVNALRFFNDGELTWKGDKHIQKLKKNYNAWQGFVNYVMCDDENS